MSLGYEGEKKKIFQSKPALASKGMGGEPDKTENHQQGILYSVNATSVLSAPYSDGPPSSYTSSLS